MIEIILSIFASVVSGITLFLLQGFFKRKEERDKVRDERKAKENVLILKSIDAVGKLTYANAIAIQQGHTNGEMHEAIATYKDVNSDLYDYLLEQNSKK